MMTDTSCELVLQAARDVRRLRRVADAAVLVERQADREQFEQFAAIVRRAMTDRLRSIAECAVEGLEVLGCDLELRERA